MDVTEAWCTLAARLNPVCATGFLRPKTTLMSLYAGDHKMRRVEQDAQVVLAVLAATAAFAAAGALWGLLLVIRAAARL